MDSNTSNSVVTESDSEVLHEFLFFNVLKDGWVNIVPLMYELVPAINDPVTGIKIKDINISGDISARLFLPPCAGTAFKLPVLLYVHGGGFLAQSAFATEYTNFLTRLVADGKLIAVSVEYRLFPTHSISVCYDDCWEALRWVAAHADGAGHEPWLNNHGDFRHLFIAGDSAGGNICHTLAARAASIGLPGDLAVEGIILIHPYFGEDDKMWMYMCGLSNEGPRDPRMRPAGQDLDQLGCGRVLLFVAEKDGLRNAGEQYADELVKSRWKGKLDMLENKDKDHCFHLDEPEHDEAILIHRRIISFVNLIIRINPRKEKSFN